MKLVSLFIFMTSLFAQVKLQAQQKNVLLICMDDLNLALGSYGNSKAITPNLDSLAQVSTQFNHAYSQLPRCGPSRASFLTGLLPHEIGIFENTKHFRDNKPDIVTLPQLFKMNDYVVKGTGKIFHSGLNDSLSWDEFYDPRINPYLNSENIRKRRDGNFPPAWENEDVGLYSYYDGDITAWAKNQLMQMSDQPFFLSVGFKNPHLPHTSPLSVWETLSPLEIDPIPAISIIDSLVYPYVAGRTGLADFDEGLSQLTLATAMHLKKQYYSSVSYVDLLIGELIHTLKQQNLYENTVVVFISDHGYRTGEFGQFTKGSSRRKDSHVPLIVHMPGQTTGKQIQDLVGLIDLYPTLAQIANLSYVPSDLAGNSFHQVLDSTAAATYIKRKFIGAQRSPSATLINEIADSVVSYSMITEKSRTTFLVSIPNDSVISVNYLLNQAYDNEVLKGKNEMFSYDELTFLEDFLQTYPIPTRGIGESINSYGIISHRFIEKELPVTTSETYSINWADVNGDGFDDLWIGRHFLPSPSFLLMNQRGINFNINRVWLNSYPEKDAHTGVFFDIDRDGDQDFYETGGGENSQGPGSDNTLYISQNGRYSDFTADYNLLFSNAQSRMAIPIDWNRDGLIDLINITPPRTDSIVVTTTLYLQDDQNFFDFYKGSSFFGNAPGQYAFVTDINGDRKHDFVLDQGGKFPKRIFDIDTESKIDINALFPSEYDDVNDICSGDFNGDTYNDLFLSRSGYCSQFYNHDSFLTLWIEHKETTDTTEINFIAGDQIKLAEFKKGDEKVDPADFFVCSDTTEVPFNNLFELVINKAIASCAESTSEAKISINYNSTTSRWTIQLIGKNTSDISIKRYRLNILSNDSFIDPVFYTNTSCAKEDILLIYDPSSMKYYNGNLQISDSLVISSESSVAADFDSDGDLDIYVTCAGVILDKPNYFLWNDGQGNFTYETGPELARGDINTLIWGGLGFKDRVAIADFNLDGMMDIVIPSSAPVLINEQIIINESNSRTILYENTPNGNHWIQFDLQGTVSNTDAIGSTIFIKSNNLIQKREQVQGVHRSSQNSKRIHFGLGTNESINYVEILWDLGANEKHRNIAANQTVKLIERTKPLYLTAIPDTIEILMNDTLSISTEMFVTNKKNYKLNILDGQNYRVQSGKVIPDSDFIGLLRIPILIMQKRQGNQSIFHFYVRVNNLSMGARQEQILNNENNDEKVSKSVSKKTILYSNPSVNELLINSEDEITQVLIFDLSGKLISIQSGNTINISMLEVGVYNLIIKQKNSTESQLFIKKSE